MNANRKSTRSLAKATAGVEIQGLESRMMLSASPLKVTLSRGLLSVVGTKIDDQITVSYSSGIWTIANSDWSLTKTGTVTSLNINAGAGNDTVTVDATVTVPVTLVGDLGDDVLTSSTGNASINGGAGNDTLTSDAGNDKLYGAAGNDSLIAGAGDDFVQGGLGDDIISGGAGTNTLDYSDHTAATMGMTVDLAAGTATRIGETDTFSAEFTIFNGGGGADSITGTDAADVIYGGAGNDTINSLGGADSLFDGAGNDSVSSGDGDDKITNGAGNDSVDGGAGDDSIYGGAGNDTFNGGEGDDLLISLGGGALDSVTGGEGYDVYWVDSGVNEIVTDASDAETAAGTVHQVVKFANVASKELGIGKIADPKLTSTSFIYRSFADRPVFASGGPTIDDVAQGQVGDCYFLATLASIAKTDPERIRQSIVNLGDGTFAVQFVKNGVKSFVRVDNDIATYKAYASYNAYASFGQENSMWVPLMEKAFAYFRKGANSYASISAGLMSEVYSAFGSSGSTLFASSHADANAYVSAIKDLLDSGKSVTAAVYSVPAGTNLVGSHAYTVESVIDNGDGTFSVRVRNPWGVDGYSSNDASNDGYVTLTAAQAFAGLSLVQSASV